MNDTLLSTLKNIGLSDKEIALYRAALSSGVCSIKQLADDAGFNRTTAYRFLTALHKRGLVEWVVGARGRLVQVAPFDSLAHYLKEEQRRLAGIEAALPQAIDQLKAMEHRKKLTTQVRYFEGQLGIKQMIWNTLRAESDTRSYASLTRREVISPSFEDEFEREWARKGLKDRVITNEKRGEYIAKRLIPEYRRCVDIRIIPTKTYYITNDIIIYNDIFAIMSLEKDHLVGVEIENAEIAKTQASIFDIVWRVATPQGKNPSPKTGLNSAFVGQRM